MADYVKYDARVDALTIESRTAWDPEVEKSLSASDKQWLTAAIHQAPQLAAKVTYERAHTGFCREITVTLADIQRLYRERLG